MLWETMATTQEQITTKENNMSGRTYGPEEQAKLKKIIDEGATVLSEVEDLSAGLKDTVKAVAEELEIKPALINKAIKIAHKGEWSKYSEAFDSLENLIIAVGKDKQTIPIMKYMVDIDNTICYNANSDYEQSQPDMERIAKLNKLFDEGHEIHYWTARGGNSGIDWTELTNKQLNDWGVKHTSINMKKPVYDVWVDDRAVNIKDFFNEN